MRGKKSRTPAMIDLAVLTQWAGAIALLISLLTTVYTLVTSTSKKTASALEAFQESCGRVLEKLEGSLAAQEKRIQALEGEMRHLPDKDAVHRLELKLGEIQVDVVKIGASAEQSARTTQRMESFLLQQAGA